MPTNIKDDTHLVRLIAAEVSMDPKDRTQILRAVVARSGSYMRAEAMVEQLVDLMVQVDGYRQALGLPR